MRWNLHGESLFTLLKVLGETTKRGTNVHFWPDDTIFSRHPITITIFYSNG